MEMSSWSSWKVSICQDYHHPELMKENGLGCSYLRTIEFVIWTRHNRAITLVRPVRTILEKTTHLYLVKMVMGVCHLVSIASPPGRNAKTVFTPELATVARGKI